ncbi:unnamed protein product [Allacma fusca]|uniref:AN1-type domain-containing protein n=1 Tax=Allacma fusca TaxID=39272 RepID=A0A8J2JPU7_9HEXA|nr:unnamed protein product [Allacma fusca]
MDPDPSRQNQSKENLPIKPSDSNTEVVTEEEPKTNNEYSNVTNSPLVNRESGTSSESDISKDTGNIFVKPSEAAVDMKFGNFDKNDDSGKSGDSDKNESADEGISDAGSNSSSGSHSHSNKAKKTNRCQVCRKKVGLTGFVCRCGGLFCSIHRYSDKHNCTFNYREMGAEEIRKNNPVVLGEKIHKI